MCDKIYEIKRKKRRRKKIFTGYFKYLLLIIGIVVFMRFSYSVLSKDTEKEINYTEDVKESHEKESEESLAKESHKKWSEEVLAKESEENINSDTVEQAVSLKNSEHILSDVEQLDKSTEQKESVSNTDASTEQKQSVSNADASTKQKQSVSNTDASTEQKQSVSNTDASTEQKESVSNTDASTKQKQSVSNTDASTEQKESVSNINALSETEMVQYINEHKELYTERLVEIANSRPELVDFAYNYVNKENYKNDPGTYEINCDEVPLLLQWDKKWGYKKYGDGMIGYTGCGPTCLSMVVIYLTKDTSLTPDVIAEFAEQKGYSIPGHGTSWTLMSEGSKSYGLSVKEICLDENMMVQELMNGNPIICAMDVGDFTDQGHYIVITGYEDGAFTVNDPNSIENSNKTWTYDRISSQIRNIWSFSILSSF